jgi:hypothetical protein
MGPSVMATEIVPVSAAGSTAVADDPPDPPPQAASEIEANKNSKLSLEFIFYLLRKGAAGDWCAASIHADMVPGRLLAAAQSRAAWVTDFGA